MHLLNQEEINFVAGGDAAATRPAGTNSWGEKPGDSSGNGIDKELNCQWNNAIHGGGIIGWMLCKLPIFQ